MALGPLMIDVQGLTLTQEEKEVLRHPLVGGIILFSRNFADADQVTQLISDIHSLREPRLLVAVDQEGGRVQRFREGFTRLPPMRRFGEIYDKDQKKARKLAFDCGWLMASEMRAIGVDISFAPVLDVDAGVSEVIGDRAFHSKPHIIADLAHEFMRGMNKAGMAATGKHFPGHGNVAADSHVAMPVDDRRYEDIADDILPFERMIHYGLAAIMPAHVIYPRVDSQPAGFSRIWVHDILRQRLGFQGVIFSDDLSMEGATVAGSYTDRARLALSAGCDMVLICNNPDAARQVINELGEMHDPVSQMRLVRLHGKGHESRSHLMNNPHWQELAREISALVVAPSLDLNL